MEYTRLGRSGLVVSRVWLGMMSYGDPGWRDWVLPRDDAEPFVLSALEAGITVFDTADMYSDGESERITGELLRRHARREEVVVATKLWFPHGDHPNAGGLSRRHVFDAIDRSLANLGMDHVDLWQVHRWDPHTPVEETMEALDDVVRSGRVRYLGASSMWAWQFAKAQHAAATNGWTRFVSMQNHHNLLYREEEREMIPQCIDMGVGVVPWSPLARGLLARPPDEQQATRRGASDHLTPQWYADVATPVIEEVARIAADRGVSRAQVALAWLLHQPGVTAPVVGATRLSHLDEAVAAVDLDLSDDELAALAAPYRPREVHGHE